MKNIRFIVLLTVLMVQAASSSCYSFSRQISALDQTDAVYSDDDDYEDDYDDFDDDDE
jgi:hypothetical protein